MPQLGTGYIVMVAVLGTILVVLVVVFLLVALVMIKKRNLWCFKKQNADSRPILLSDRELEARYGLRKSKRKSGAFGKARKAKASSKKNKLKYQSLGRSRFPKIDPFANKYLENPMVTEEDLDEDWTNPMFDEEAGRIHDAVVLLQCWYRMIRVRIPYLQLKEATVLAQSLYRGRLIRRRLPQLRREKQEREHLRKKHAGWKKKGTLSALRFYEVKGFGFAEVEQLYGLEIIREAALQLKQLYGGKGRMRLKLFISIKGIKLFDYHSMKHFATVNVSSVSFCTLDPKNRKLFAFINRKKKRKFCHVFQANEQDAQKMVETMAEAFEVTFKQIEQKRQDREIARLSDIKKQAFHRQSQELDNEVASMMEMAETASITTPSLRRSSMSEGSTTSENNSVRGSRERLLPSSTNRRPWSESSTSSLLISHRAQVRPTERREEEVQETFDPNKVDDYFTDIKEGVDNIATTLERERKRMKIEAEQNRIST